MPVNMDTAKVIVTLLLGCGNNGRHHRLAVRWVMSVLGSLTFSACIVLVILVRGAMTPAIVAAVLILVVLGALAAIIPAYSCPQALPARLYCQGIFMLALPYIVASWAYSD